MKSTLALLALTSILSIAAFADDSPYLCKKAGNHKSGPAKFDLRRWSELLRIKFDPKGKIEFAGMYDSSYHPETSDNAGYLRYKDFTSQNTAIRAVLLSPAVSAGRISGKVRLELANLDSKYVTYDCSRVK